MTRRLAVTALLTHPFDRIARGRVRIYAIPLFALWGVLSLLLVWAAPGSESGTIAELALAGSVERVAEILATWSERDRISFAFILGFDLLYDIVHNNAVALACIAASRALGPGWVGAAGHALAWLLWVATPVNFLESVAFLEILRDGPTSPWPELGAYCVYFRNLAIAAGIVYALLGALAAALDRLWPERSGV